MTNTNSFAILDQAADRVQRSVFDRQTQLLIMNRFLYQQTNAPTHSTSISRAYQLCSEARLMFRKPTARINMTQNG
eukprot:5624447-Pyramimonas_sp.AAC.1